jgi:hypothetical protein
VVGLRAHVAPCIPSLASSLAQDRKARAGLDYTSGLDRIEEALFDAAATPYLPYPTDCGMLVHP